MFDPACGVDTICWKSPQNVGGCTWDERDRPAVSRPLDGPNLSQLQQVLKMFIRNDAKAHHRMAFLAFRAASLGLLSLLLNSMGESPKGIVVVLKRPHTWNRSNIQTLRSTDMFIDRIKDMTAILLREDVAFGFEEVRTCTGVICREPA